MIEKITTWIKSQAIALVILGMMLVGGQTASFGAAGDINTQPVWFVKGLTAGNPKVSVIDSSGNVVGPVTSSTGTYSGTLSVTGATTVGLFTQGGGVTATSTTATTATLPASYFDTENVIDVTPNGASLTLTLPASSTLPLGTTAGSARTIYIRNATTTAGVLLTIAGSTGVTLRSASSTAVIQSSTGGQLYGVIDFVRQSNSNIGALLTTFNQ